MYVCPANIERVFLHLTVSSNVGDRINSVRKSGDQSDRRDIISGGTCRRNIIVS